MVFDALMNDGGGLVAALPQVLILLGFTLVTFAIASLLFKYE